MDDEDLRSQQSKDLIRSWSHAPEAKAIESNYAWLDIALGGALFFGFFGASLGLLPDLIGDTGGAFIASVIGVAAGVVAGILGGLLVWIIGAWLAARLGIERFLRSHIAGRLDQGRGRVLYAGAVGALGGIVLRLGFFIGNIGPIKFESVGVAVAIALLLWSLASIAGALINLLITRIKSNIAAR